MKKFLVFLPLLLFSLNIDFSPCYKKYSFIKNFIPVSSSRSVTFKKPLKYIYYDEFSGMYVVSSRNKTYIHFYNTPKIGWFMAALNYESAYGGTYARDMEFLNPALLSVNVPPNTVISDIFCRAYGLGNGGVIRGDYVKHFVKYGYWGDIGIDADKNMNVLYIDPFYVDKIVPGDKITEINGKKAGVELFNKTVILGLLNDKVCLKTANGKKECLKIRKKVYEFTPLEHFGIKVDKHLNVIKLSKEIKNKIFLKPPAKIIAVNGKKIKSFAELKKILSFDKNVTITLEKNGIRISLPLRK